jgi:predicted XRE-type DNA-binding protein
MNSYTFDIGAKSRKVSRFVGQVRSELQRALSSEKANRKLTQQQIATAIGVHRSVINRQITGVENLTLRSVAEIAWALGWEIEFSLRKPEQPTEVRSTPNVPSAATKQAYQLPPSESLRSSDISNLNAEPRVFEAVA